MLNRIDWKFLGLWIGAMLLAIPIAIFSCLLVFILTNRFWGNLIEDLFPHLAAEAVQLEWVISFFRSGLTYGLLVGLAQWLVLLRKFPKPMYWLVATCLGEGLACGVLIISLVELNGAIAGLVVGVCQWIALVLQFPRDDAW
ncbi:MAG: hypothetical protein MUF49_10955, partial [Oculatellaceae cyanobacterium Prado106]|nr:hypothetical protein [Oculatellaceae cyanobacterium Prado106]